MRQLSGMRALTVCQPWATYIAIGLKQVENRGWRPSPFLKLGQDPVLLHAGKKALDREAEEDVLSAVALGTMQATNAPKTWPSFYPLGSALGIFVVEKVIDAAFSSSLASLPPDQQFFFNGPYGWVVRMVELFDEPVPMKGALGLWRVP